MITKLNKFKLQTELSPIDLKGGARGVKSNLINMI